MALVDQLLKTYITFPQSLLAPFIKNLVMWIDMVVIHTF